VRDNVVTAVYVLTTDATVSRLHERNLHAMAHTDAMTNLPNRRHFDAALQTSAGLPATPDRGLALLYLDIDHFKQINDTFGHAVGDAVLVEFARRLRATIRGSDVVARLAGDEFTVLLQDLRAAADVDAIARKILAAVREPFALAGHRLDIRTTIGAAVAHGAAMTPRLLMEAADGALYAAKEAGRDTYAVRDLAATAPVVAVPALA